MMYHYIRLSLERLNLLIWTAETGESLHCLCMSACVCISVYTNACISVSMQVTECQKVGEGLLKLYKSSLETSCKRGIITCHNNASVEGNQPSKQNKRRRTPPKPTNITKKKKTKKNNTSSNNIQEEEVRISCIGSGTQFLGRGL